MSKKRRGNNRPDVNYTPTASTTAKAKQNIGRQEQLVREEILARLGSNGRQFNFKGITQVQCRQVSNEDAMLAVVRETNKETFILPFPLYRVFKRALLDNNIIVTEQGA